MILLVDFRAEGWAGRRMLPRVGRAALVGLGAAAVMIGLQAVHPILGIIGGLLAYGAGLLVMGVLAPDDWDLLYRLAAAMPGGALVRKYWQRDVKVDG
jgi:hypothetical protein